jgi:ankyrin repeat protein
MKKNFSFIGMSFIVLSLFGMEPVHDLMGEMPELPKDAQFANALVKCDLPEVKRLLSLGARLPGHFNDTLSLALSRFPSDKQCRLSLVKLLLESGVDLSQMTATGYTLLMLPAYTQDPDLVFLMLVTIPEQDQQELQKARDNIFTAKLVLKRKGIPKDVRTMIVQKMVDELIDQQMARIKDLLSQEDWDTLTAYDHAIDYPGRELVTQMLDLDDLESYKRIRNGVRENVMRIIFGSPQPQKYLYTTPLSVQEALGEWDEL